LVYSFREAIKIIESLNGAMPFKFRIEVALTDEERTKRRQLKNQTDQETEAVSFSRIIFVPHLDENI